MWKFLHLRFMVFVIVSISVWHTCLRNRAVCSLPLAEWEKQCGGELVTCLCAMKKGAATLDEAVASSWLESKIPFNQLAEDTEKYGREPWTMETALPFSVKSEWLRKCIFRFRPFCMLATVSFFSFPVCVDRHPTPLAYSLFLWQNVTLSERRPSVRLAPLFISGRWCERDRLSIVMHNPFLEESLTRPLRSK